MIKLNMLYTFRFKANHEIVLKKVYREIKVNKNAWLKSYIDMDTDLRKNGKKWFGTRFFKLINNVIFGKTFSFSGKDLVSEKEEFKEF